ncbi:MAG: zf-HC2 domain-containing protein [Deltaproteobacteria bacterium]|nr:zf-HC2 domain-containing protein [Deltaproteobacteria bacterium]MBW2487321.1 zf-HC2 domain-containing protein [Deltaproteobacteria bacterium]MBW2517152.1 zf-HC2 domain-containing protein [Deltaproteobacteria bacterium]
MRWMYNCKEVSEMVSESMDRVLPFYQRVLIRMHLLMCKYCVLCKEQFETIRATMRYEELHGKELDASRSLSKDGKERLKEFLKNQLTD